MKNFSTCTVKAIRARRLRFAGHVFITQDIKLIKLNIKLNLWLTAPKGTTSVNQTSESEWQMPLRLDIVISITLGQVY